MKWLIGVLIAASAFAQTTTERPSPFGFSPGMTEAEIVSAVGKSAIEAKTDYALVLKTAPKPNSEFARYSLSISSSKGLGKVRAISYVTSNRSGEQVRDKFETIRTAIIAKYGPPFKEFDFVHSGALWSADNEFMQALASGERTLAAFWRVDTTVLHQTRSALIALEAEATDSYTASVVLSYEFQPEFDALIKERDAAKSTTY